MRVRTKIRIIFLAVIGIALLTGAVSLWSIALLGDALGAANESLGTQARAERLRTLIHDEASEERVLAVIEEETGKRPPSGAKERFAAFRAEVDALVAELGEGEDVAKVRSQLNGLENFVIYGKRTMKEFGQSEKTIKWLRQGFLPDLNRYVNRLIEVQQVRVRSATEIANRSERRVVALIWTSSILLLAAAAVGLALFRRWILLPVLTLSDATRRISGGHYQETIPIAGVSEFARLARDIEEMSRSIARFQTQLVEKERMAAVGEMTASVAHNVRNPLASIRALAQTCHRDPSLPEPLRGLLATVMETVDRADRWLKDLLTALRPVRLKQRPEDVRAVLEEIARGSRPFAERKGVEIELDLERDLPPLPLDRRNFEQAVIVLISNSVEASPSGSTVTIRAGRDPGGSERLRVVVEDRGTGMEPETLRKLFTPYFSTKRSGIGLGLCLAQKIVFGHRGTIDVDSAPGTGTRMTVWLPLMTPAEDGQDGADPDPR